MSTRPAVHVVVPTADRATLLPRAIDSALAQSRPPARITVVDDHSRDGTRAMLASRYGADERVQTLALDTARGPGAARHAALDPAFELTAFLDSDDAWDPGYLAAQCAVLEADETLDAVTAQARYVGVAGGLYATTRDRPDAEPPVSLSAVCGGAFVHASTVVVRTEAAAALGLVSAGVPHSGNAAFLAWWLALLGAGRTCRSTPEILCTLGADDYGPDRPPLSADREDAALAADEVRVVWAEACAECGRDAVDLVRRRARYHVARGERRQARPYLWKWWKRKPDSTQALFGLLRALVSRK